MGSRAQARQPWHTGLVAPRPVGFSRTRARTHVPCIGRQILNHWTTREVLGFSLFEEALLVFEAQDPNLEWYTKVAAAVQNAIQCYAVSAIHDKKKRATTQTSLDRFFKRVDRIESSKELEPVPSTSGVSEIAACPPSAIADDPSALPSPSHLLSLLQSVTLLACSLDASPCMPAVVLYYCIFQGTVL